MKKKYFNGERLCRKILQEDNIDMGENTQNGNIEGEIFFRRRILMKVERLLMEIYLEEENIMQGGTRKGEILNRRHIFHWKNNSKGRNTQEGEVLKENPIGTT